jgi:hypothetical protein
MDFFRKFFYQSENLAIFNEKTYIRNMKAINYSSRFLLYLFKMLIFIGLILIFFDNAGFFSSSSYFGQLNLATALVFAIGTFLSYVAVPILYFSSFEKYKNHDEFWDQEMFWILPIFFFATFFQYGSGVYFMLASLIASVLIVFAIHGRFMMLSRKMAISNESLEPRNLYFENMKYLTIYYILLVMMYVFLHPAERLHNWISGTF